MTTATIARLAAWLLLCLAVVGARPAVARDAVVVLKSDDLAVYDEVIASFEQAWGRPVTVISIEGDRQRARDVVTRLRFDPPPVVLALGAKAAFVVHQDMPAVPLVHAMVRNPARYGVVGRNVTGVQVDMPLETVMSQVQLFLPDRKRVGVVLTSQNPVARDLRVAARAMDLELDVAEVQTRREVRGAVVRLCRDVDVLLVVFDPEVLTPENFRFMRERTRGAGIPVVATSEALARAGALLAVVPDYEETGIQAAEMVRRIVDEGAVPGQVAPVTPEGVRVILNRSTLDALDLDMDPMLLDFTDEVVEEAAGR